MEIKCGLNQITWYNKTLKENVALSSENQAKVIFDQLG